MASYPHLIDEGIMGHCIHGKTGLCAKAGICRENMLVPNFTTSGYGMTPEIAKLPTGLVSVGEGAFQGCKLLENSEENNK